MSIKASIYDFLAYGLPGGIVMAILLHVVETFGGPDYFSQLGTYNFSNWLIFGIVAYLAGHTVDPVITKITGFFMRRRKAEEAALNEMKGRNPALEIDINPADWAIWFATIRRESLDLAYEIDRFNAQSKMMRGLDMASFLGFWAVLSYVIFDKWPPASLGLLPVFLIVSFLAIRQAAKFKKWFFMIIFETVISRKPPFSEKSVP